MFSSFRSSWTKELNFLLKLQRLNTWPKQVFAVRRLIGQEVDNCAVISSNDVFQVETAESLPNLRASGTYGKDRALEVLQEATSVCETLFERKKTAKEILNSWKHPSTLQGMILLDRCKKLVVGEHICFPLHKNRQGATEICFFLKRAVNRIRQLSKRPVAIVGLRDYSSTIF